MGQVLFSFPLTQGLYTVKSDTMRPTDAIFVLSFEKYLREKDAQDFSLGCCVSPWQGVYPSQFYPYQMH